MSVKIFLPRHDRPPFSNEVEQAKAYKQLFNSALGKKVLTSLILDMEYHKDELPNVTDAQLRFKSGIRFVINHILNAVNVKYEEQEQEETY